MLVWSTEVVSLAVRVSGVGCSSVVGVFWLLTALDMGAGNRVYCSERDMLFAI